MFDKILIANRGEIALRIMRAARELGIRTVAVYSLEDFNTYPVKYADEAVNIGSMSDTESYLSIPKIIETAQSTGAQAIHPGCGFLAEDAQFARACAEAGIVFIGPSPECIERMGDRSVARGVLRACGVPVVSGSAGVVESAEDARNVARRLGYPVVVKAAAGSGKDAVIVRDPSDIEQQFEIARAAAAVVYGNDGVYIEKLVPDARHVEVQVLGDGFGNRVALCERDCSVQLDHRKLVEESPSPAVSSDLRRAMSVAAVKALRALDYQGAGSVEFLLASDGSFHFVGMGTCLPVEHAVNEQVTGVDIVKEQIRIAAGEPMSCCDRGRFEPFGHAIELRIDARDPENGFSPCPGTIARFEAPSGPGVRVETYARTGSRVSPHYDPLVAKLVVYGQDRAEAIARGRRALDEFVIEGVPTTIPFNRRVLDNEVFCAGEATTDFIEAQMGDLL
ncbi:MAG: ATP-grasp domain-containing protein [Eggerthellaceae bacterium]|nr:ATP-grasp domain-containing protein [Eggerthellaceae bacterium]